MQFAIIGVLNTGVHASVVVVGVEWWKWRAVFSNVLAFVVSNVFSYVLNSKFTFGEKMSLVGYVRFFAVSIVSFMLVILITWLGEINGVHYLVSLLVVVFVVPVLNFFVLKFWAYSNVKEC